MEQIKGWYYLHVDKDLIYEPDPSAIMDIRDSDLCHSAWAWTGERSNAWKILVETLSLGARKDRINELVKKWGCNNEDAVHYADCLKITLGQDGNQKTAHRSDFINLAESPCGFGNTYLEAMADLCKQLGFKGGKMWQTGFEDLVCD